MVRDLVAISFFEKTKTDATPEGDMISIFASVIVAQFVLSKSMIFYAEQAKAVDVRQKNVLKPLISNMGIRGRDFITFTK